MSESKTVSPLRQRMIEDMAARKLNPHTQRSHICSHIYSCKRFAAWLKRSPDTATTRCAVFSSTSSRAARASVTAIGS
jgi:integrase/recombinase XerD